MGDLGFDAFVRAIAAGASRRQALRLLAAGALAAWFPRPVWAAPARQDGVCAPGLTFCEEQPSWAPAGCYDLASDYLHCGSCMHQCPSAGPVEMACVGGECLAIGCLEGEVDCTGNLDCTDLAWDPFNCGACGVVCETGTCEEGRCAQLACGELAYCEVAGGWYCADLSSDPLNCGDCGVVCDSGVCEGWACAGGCGEGLAYCPARSDGQPAGCYDLFSDYFHCGSCDHSCPTAGAPGVVCYAGECTLPPCDGGLIRCEGVGCVDLLFDPNNCGRCGIVCASGVCDGGTCAPEQTTCAPGLTFCEEQPNWAPAGCYDLASDYLHCGSCMHQCPSAGPVEMACVGGECLAIGCLEGEVDCTGNLDCTDLNWDPDNCGACGNVCASGVCEAGNCAPAQTACAAGLTFCPARSDGQPAGCYDLSADYWHCGTCEMSCPTAGFHGVCRGGDCVEITCGEGLTYCSAGGNGLQPGCYDLSSDRFHCGECHIQCPTTVGCFAGECTVPPCDEGLTRCADGCVDLDADPDNCGECGNACASGVCEAGVCAQTATQTITEAAAPTGTGGSAQETRPPRTRRSDDTAPAQAQSAEPDSVLTWPFDPDAGQWTIVNGYRGEDEHALPTDSGRNFSLFALDFAVCRPEDVDAEDGTCDLERTAGDGEEADELAWDREATRGATVFSPVDGTVAWTEESSPTCRGFAIDIAGHPGYRLALFNVDNHPRRGRAVMRGRPIGKVAENGCEQGDHIHMVLYKPRAGAGDDPVEGREGVPFAGEWAIDGCDYPDDKRTVDQYRGELVPCTTEDDAAAGS